ncbi:CRISPR-associated helicase Cas3' [Marinobacterium sp. D7]|uniref:type I-G CRISPR-associated helicase/endonuclease Cas3g n=1 Tax=Marinobacterium ramblicola TaxID=2849041 RepID=UPI001C2CE63A|nr:CRISPR-associated helicase Cas3' [Marinobacterium ramblicola]MBV1788009.1 CRISPR-associated helicase Cas3' [Marinobacterium ramblicola]
MNFTDFFKKAYGHASMEPLPYQARLATSEDWPDVLNVPTGLGKTAAVTLAWLYRKTALNDPSMPRRLVWCLPMRVLVEQTEANIRAWLARLGLAETVGVHLLMGGSEDILKATWAESPESPAILIGTQDMLLSRALMRGYGMSRYQWPIHFALLHNDALWVYDEVQLMGPALSSSAQLEAFRRTFPLGKGSRSLWVSATLRRQWLGTVDLKPQLDSLQVAALTEDDLTHPVARQRVNGAKRLAYARTDLNSGNARKKAKDYLSALAAEIMAEHRPNTQTLVILNRVERAQELYKHIVKQHDPERTLLLHARFRPAERQHIERQLQNGERSRDRIVIATQAIEAGVDITSTTLFTELAPWASLVQRFGRCNRYGECDNARLFCINIDEAVEATPYPPEPLSQARTQVDAVIQAGGSAGPGQLPSVGDRQAVELVLRRRDFIELFNTDADLSGQDIDISLYIRDTGVPQSLVFWRDFTDSPEDQPPPLREELCPVAIGQLQDHLSKKIDAWFWDTVAGRWSKQDKSRVRPGQTLLLKAADGGYAPTLGFVAGAKGPVVDIAGALCLEEESYTRDDLCYIGRYVELGEHLADAEAEARKLCRELALADGDAQSVIKAASLHDWGKAHEAFQHMLTHRGGVPEPGKLWAKSDQGGKPEYRMQPVEGEERGALRPHFRHELASMLAWLEHNPDHARRDLIAYLMAAHHGKVRMGLRALPKESQPRDDRLFARGVWSGDLLPPVPLVAGQPLPETTLRLDLMRLGDGPMGPSWTARTQKLLADLGPFQLAWLETLVRIADWRASKGEANRKPQGEQS